MLKVKCPQLVEQSASGVKTCDLPADTTTPEPGAYQSVCPLGHRHTFRQDIFNRIKIA